MAQPAPLLGSHLPPALLCVRTPAMEDQKPDGQGGPLDQATLLQVIASGTQAQNQTMLAVQVSEFETTPPMVVQTPLPLVPLAPALPSTHLSRGVKARQRAPRHGPMAAASIASCVQD